MAAKNPRLSVVLTPSLAATLAQISEVSGESASAVVRGLLLQSEPALGRMLELLKAASRAKDLVGSGLGDTLSRVVDDLETAVAVADERMSRMTGDLVAKAEAEELQGRRRSPGGGSAAPRRPGAVGGVLTPGPVTRGSGHPKGAKARGRGPVGG